MVVTGRGGRVLELEAVAHPCFGDEVARPCGVGLELAADLSKVDAEVVRLLLVLRPSDLLEELTLGDELAGVTDEHLDDVPFGRGQAHFAIGVRDASSGKVDDEVLGLHDRFLLGRRRAPQREQLVHAERFRDVRLTEAIWHMLTRNRPFAPAGAPAPMTA